MAWVTDELLVGVSGDDARTWLNGQMTADVKLLGPARPVHGLVLSVKGRILAEALAIDHPEHGVLVAVPRAVWPKLEQHLSHYIIMEDVTLTPRDELALITVQGVLGAPSAEWLRHDRLGEAPGFDRVVPRAAADEALSALGARVVTSNDAELERLRIRAGRPRFALDFGEHTYPQEAGLEKALVSFSKGCYLGQEVVCMLESRGQISRRLVMLDEARGLLPGTELRDARGERVGEITSASDEGRALAFVKRAHVGAGETLFTAAGVSPKVLGPATMPMPAAST